MLRIITTASGPEQRWILCGQLRGPWVTELRENWERARRESRRRRVVDLTDVTFIDEDGEHLLRAMRREGAQFVAMGVDTKHVLENLKTRGERPLRRFLNTHNCGSSRGDNQGGRSE